ncbi:hypothetical protein MSAN_00505500 [Mycena sanguinolenta]|uniref:Uncharacterized protein n=1 Tax=Mycena sanguinolenta TaxID=230812 RepID=A0A8H6Z8Y6_9AGAR|nr:hypothetical protein MSAN_00505500 [Mycena sanguinolenta]
MSPHLGDARLEPLFRFRPSVPHRSACGLHRRRGTKTPDTDLRAQSFPAPVSARDRPLIAAYAYAPRPWGSPYTTTCDVSTCSSSLFPLLSALTDRATDQRHPNCALMDDDPTTCGPITVIPKLKARLDQMH